MVLEVPVQDEVITGFLRRVRHHGRNLNRANHLYHEPRSHGKGRVMGDVTIPLQVRPSREGVKIYQKPSLPKSSSLPDSSTLGPTTFIHRHGREHFQTVELIKEKLEQDRPDVTC